VKALLSTAIGGPRTLQLTDLPTPVPGPGQAVVAVKACGVNFPDVLIIEDKYQTKVPRPFAPGAEIAGVVISTAADVTAVKPGDRVICMLIWGGMAEQIAVDATRLIKLPDQMPFDEAAAFVLTYGTSHHALKQRARLQPGDRLLVLGAAGGVGLAAVQLGKAMGAQVVAAASTQDKVDFCKRHGADEGITYERGPLDRDAQKMLTTRLKQVAGERGFDVIYDAVGGDYAEPALRSIAWQGRYLVIGFAAGDIPKMPLNLALLKSCDILGVYWGAWVDRNPQTHRQNVDELLSLYAQGKIKPYVSERFSLDKGGEAIEHLASRKALGKVVVTMA
jgi:NADPH:quinone reductase